jgi:hypothetical protein
MEADMTVSPVAHERLVEAIFDAHFIVFLESAATAVPRSRISPASSGSAV